MSKKAIIRLMQSYGSTFEQRLADLWVVADRDNRRKIEDCWPSTFAMFEDWLRKGETAMDRDMAKKEVSQ